MPWGSWRNSRGGWGETGSAARKGTVVARRAAADNPHVPPGRRWERQDRLASRIRILSEAVANRIAAGEVVEGPYSVVKELVENALDAGADEISIDVKGGGSDLVRVADNGFGMNADDAVAAFDRFATSKLRSEDELSGIATLGFRGEALPSIASVSRLRLLTCERENVEGTEVNLVGGEIRDVRPAGRASGTTVEVSSLFFNTPARRKFLKSDRVEVRRIMDLVSEYAVLYPKVRFDVSVDGKLVLGLLPTDDLRERAAGVLGAGTAKEMFPIALEDGPYAVAGLVGKPSLARQRGALQVIAVNGRPVRSGLLAAAVRSGYGELLPRDRHPVALVFLTVDGTLVDVNVHPTKREVRFGESRKVFAAVERAVREALLAHDVAPTFTPAPDSRVRLSGVGAGPAPAGEQLPLPDEIREAGAPGPDRREGEPPAAGRDDARDAKFWQLHSQYIFVQTREGVLLIDQHAAHERVLYEKARKGLTGAADAGPSQQLLFPVAVELSPAEHQGFQEVSPLLARLGFVVRELSGRTVILEAVPGAFPNWPHERILQDILAELPSQRSATRDLVDSIARTVACKTAIKAGDSLRQEEMRALVDQLFATELPYSCPHGRPTFMRMTLSELDKRFGRT
jgi:DNA mismatch repair protein MutL